MIGKMFFALFCLKPLALQAAESWYFRGSSNYWLTTPMSADKSGVQWSITVDFAKEEDSPRFKIDHYGDWKESYPAQDFPVQECSRYFISFRPGSKTVSVKRLGAVTSGQCAVGL